MLGYTHPPAQCLLGYGQQAGGTHPTGMHSYFVYVCEQDKFMQVPFCEQPQIICNCEYAIIVS